MYKKYACDDYYSRNSGNPKSTKRLNQYWFLIRSFLVNVNFSHYNMRIIPPIQYLISNTLLEDKLKALQSPQRKGYRYNGTYLQPRLFQEQ